jgi:hypothetical protein
MSKHIGYVPSKFTQNLGVFLGPNVKMEIPIGTQLGLVPNWGWCPIGAQTPIGGLSLPLVFKDRPYIKKNDKKVKRKYKNDPKIN